nr:MAG TPA: hypothetical protein [Caudoviricetes sp.]
MSLVRPCFKNSVFFTDFKIFSLSSHHEISLKIVVYLHII